MEFALIDIFGKIMAFQGVINVDNEKFLFILRVEDEEIIEALITQAYDGTVLKVGKGGAKHEKVKQAINDKYIKTRQLATATAGFDMYSL